MAKKKPPSPPDTRKTCPECGELFEPTRSWQNFCSSEHRASYHNKTNSDILRKYKEQKNGGA